MKKTTFTLLLSLYCCCLAAQCPTGDVYFYTQAQLDAFPINYPSCKNIEGDVLILGDDIQTLAPLTGLESIEGNLTIGDLGTTSTVSQPSNLLLPNLHGLDSLRVIGGNLGVFYNPSLVNLEGLNNLKYIGENLAIARNHALTSLHGLENLDTLAGSMSIGVNVPGFGGGYPIGNNALPNLNGLNNIRHIWGDLSILAGALQNTTGLDSLRSIAGSFEISSQGAFGITTFTGLENLELIEGAFTVDRNQSLKSFSGLEHLESILVSFSVTYNDSLVDFKGLENLKYPGVTGGMAVYYNPQLKGFEGLEGAELNTGATLYIFANESLSLCDIPPICNYLANGGFAEIHNNAPGCNSVAEVEAACMVSIDKTSTGEPVITFSPNPATDFFQIQINDLENWDLRLFDLQGRQMFRQSVSGSQTIGLEDCPSGLYTLRAVSGGRVFAGKIVKQ